MAAGLQQSALVAAMRGYEEAFRSLESLGCPLHGDPLGSSRLFRGSPDQVGAVRTFARHRLAGHAALEAAVLVASELAANAIRHSASGMDGGMFLVYLAGLSPDHVAVLVTDQGGLRIPHVADADVSAESGRGLAVVKALSAFLDFFDDAELTSVLAVVTTEENQRRELAEENRLRRLYQW